MKTYRPVYFALMQSCDTRNWVSHAFQHSCLKALCSPYSSAFVPTVDRRVRSFTNKRINIPRPIFDIIFELCLVLWLHPFGARVQQYRHAFNSVTLPDTPYTLEVPPVTPAPSPLCNGTRYFSYGAVSLPYNPVVATQVVYCILGPSTSIISVLAI